MIRERDRKVIWHPYTQEKTSSPPVAIVKGEGVYLTDESGRKYIDAISSWWVNLHGHSHPYIAGMISRQLTTLEHVIFAGFTHEPAVRLAERLIPLLPGGQERIFYSDNGSTAVEAAVKMAVQYWLNKKQPRNKVIAFRNSYHGDTFGSMSLSERGAFTAPYHTMLFDVLYIEAPVPGKEKQSEQELQEVLEKNSGEVACFIYEPLIQGAGGMLMHKPGSLNSLLAICKKNSVLCIADEVMTGFGRTGKLFASAHMEKTPDMICLSKGLTGGFMPLGATSCTGQIYQAFFSDELSATFFHGHSYTANPLACTAALASLDLLLKPESFNSIERITEKHRTFFSEIKQHEGIRDVRHTGTILAIEMETGDEKTSYFNPLKQTAVPFFLERGILLRPLGNVLYILPPYCISDNELDMVYASVKEFAAYLQSIRAT